MLPPLFFLVFSSEQRMGDWRGRMAKHRGKGAGGGAKRGGRASRPQRSTKSASAYFMQPGKRGAVIVLRKPCGNRISPKVCGMMPSRVHAKMLITQLERAESVVNDLFLEATDDGIEALEAVLAACCEEVIKRGPSTSARRPGARAFTEDSPETAPADEGDEGTDNMGAELNRSEDPAA